MPSSKRGIFHNLHESSYTVSNTEIVFFFSSELYRKKFLRKYKENRNIINDRLTKNSYDISINRDMLADVYLYIDIETRGFKAWLKGADITCEELHRYALQRTTEPNTLDWQEIQKPKLNERLKIMV